MAISNAFLIAAAVFLLIGFLTGLSRGLSRSVLRLVFVVAIAVLSFYLAGVAAKYVLSLEVTVEETTVALGDWLTSAVLSMEGIGDVLTQSATLESFVFTLPEVLLRVVGFVIIFFVLKLISLPITAILSAIFLPRKKNGVPVNRHALLGSLVGLVQGAFCFLVVCVLFFGVLDVSKSFVDAYDGIEEDIEPVTEICDMAQNELFTPLSENKVIDALSKTPIPGYCTQVFHQLAYVEITTAEGTVKPVYYFEELKGMFPTIMQAMTLMGTDPDHLTEENTESIISAVVSMKDNELCTDIVSELLDKVVENSVAPEYQSSAKVFTQELLNAITNEESEVLENLDVKAEAESVTECLGLLATVSSMDTESAFTEETVDTFLNVVADSTLACKTLVNISENEELVNAVLGDVALDEDAKETTKNVIDDYRDSFLESETDQGRIDRVNSIIDAVLKVLDIENNLQ